MPINVGVSEFPEGIASRARSHDSLLQDLKHSEDYEAHKPLLEIMVELEAICDSDGIVGIQYTRGDRKRLLSEGLRARTGDEWREDFLRTHGRRFTRAQRQHLVERWDSYFYDQQNRTRDNRVWFNLTRTGLSNGGARPLLSHYGGEAISMPFSDDDKVSRILATLGEPMVVECSLRTDSVSTFCQNAWGRTWLSSYHCSVNKDALQWDVDLYSSMDIPPSAILQIDSV